jgi:hypothetical protein
VKALRPFHVLTALVAAGTWSAGAAADPQASLGLTGGAVVQDVAGPPGPSTTLHLGARADTLLLRSRNGQMALGPYADVATAGFHDVDLGGGAEWLLPLTDDVPAVLGAGAFARDGAGAGAGRSWAPGLEGTIFVGSRSFNFHSWYGLALGVFAQTRWVPAAAASPSSLDVIVGVQLDAELLVLPWLLAWGAITHSS